LGRDFDLLNNSKLKILRSQILWFLTACLVVAIAHFQFTGDRDLAVAQISPSNLPPLQAHPLPPSLAQWQDPSQSGDYFPEIKPTKVGYLVRSQFPIKIFVEPATEPPETSFEAKRAQEWVEAVSQAVKEWNVYLPFTEVPKPEEADITVWRTAPPLDASVNPQTGELQLPRARSAQTRYQFYISSQKDSPGILSHRYTIQLNPNQTAKYLQAAARHELGHALGIWGHSPLESDTMYFSQVRHPAQISTRDINTLKRIYQQPTRLGWSF